MKTTSSHLDSNSKRALLRIQWQIFGFADVTNKEFGTWLVKGYIAQEMGEAVDWAAVAAATAKELDRQVGTQRMSGLELKPGASGYNGGCPSTKEVLLVLNSCPPNWKWSPHPACTLHLMQTCSLRKSSTNFCLISKSVPRKRLSDLPMKEKHRTRRSLVSSST